MKKIASFTVNHDVLEKGLYISRISMKQSENRFAYH